MLLLSSRQQGREAELMLSSEKKLLITLKLVELMQLLKFTKMEKLFIKKQQTRI